MSDEERHHGSFAEGESDPEDYPEDENVGRFIEGQETEEEDEHVGRFSEGEEELGEDDPEKHREGHFDE
jgi:hypothetical protein